MKTFSIFLLSCFLFAGIFSGVALADKFEGAVESVNVAAGTFQVAGIEVDAKAASLFGEADVPIQLKDLETGKFVSVTGDLVDGKIKAHRINKQWRGRDSIKGIVEKADANNGKLVIGGVTVKVKADTRIENDDDDKRLKLEDIKPGAEINVHGTWTGKKEMTAKKIELE